MPDMRVPEEFRAVLSEADSLVIIVRVGEREQQFDGTWLWELVEGGDPLTDPVEVPPPPTSPPPTGAPQP